MAKVEIPTPLRKHTGDQAIIDVEGGTVRELLDALDVMHPGIKEKLVDAKGVRRFVNIFVGDEDIRFMDGIDTKVKDDDAISIIPAIAGG